MSRQSRRSREVELFNFSFLDILACVIGLLIFILSIVVVSGGGSSSRQTAGRLSNAEHQIQEARVAAQLAATRRQQAEQLLSQQSRHFADPQAAADTMRAQIRVLDNEKSEVDTATATSIARQDALRKALADTRKQPSIDPSALAIQTELRRLDEQTAELLNQIAAQHRHAQADVQHVQYYVPHVREVHRRTLWVEVSGDRIWCIGSDDYSSVALDENSTQFTRIPGASGTSIAALVGNRADVPREVASTSPRDTVLEVALHPDGYKAFRELRQWAWKKGFAVNWEPQDEAPIVLSRATHVFEQ